MLGGRASAGQDGSRVAGLGEDAARGRHGKPARRPGPWYSRLCNANAKRTSAPRVKDKLQAATLALPVGVCHCGIKGDSTKLTSEVRFASHQNSGRLRKGNLYSVV